jgi:hypothetical protein
MKRVTIKLPDDLAEAIKNYQQAQEAPPTLNGVMNAALRQYLVAHGFPQVRRTLEITRPRRNAGVIGTSREHKSYLAGIKK